MDKHIITEIGVNEVEHGFVRMTFVVTGDFKGVVTHVGRALVGKVGTIKGEGSVFVAMLVGVTIGMGAWALDEEVPSEG
jgi:hypothetical protein